MHTTTPHLSTALGESAAPGPSASRQPALYSSAPPTFGEIFDERAPIIGAPAFFGPPIISVLGPWLLLVLLLIGPFALILTAVLALAVGALLLVTVAMVLASPYLLIRHLHARGVRATSPVVHPIRKRRDASRRLGSLQPKGMS